jgi:hypothetical protein
MSTLSGFEKLLFGSLWDAFDCQLLSHSGFNHPLKPQVPDHSRIKTLGQTLISTTMSQVCEVTKDTTTFYFC